MLKNTLLIFQIHFKFPRFFHFKLKGIYYAKLIYTCHLDINVCWQCVGMCGSVCTQPTYNDKNPPTPFFLIPINHKQYLRTSRLQNQSNVMSLSPTAVDRQYHISRDPSPSEPHTIHVYLRLDHLKVAFKKEMSSY